RRGRWLEAERRDGGGSQRTRQLELAPSTPSWFPSPAGGGLFLAPLGAVIVADIVAAGRFGQTLDRNHLLALGGAEDRHPLAGAADDTDLFDAGADHLTARGDHQQVVRFLDREGGGQARARTTAQTV